MHGEIKTTMAKAKALKPYAEHIITLAKKGDVASRRVALRYIYDQETGKFLNQKGEVLDSAESTAPAKKGKAKEADKIMPETVLRKLFNSIAQNYTERKGGYTRIYRLPPRRGDGAEMALIQLV